MKRTIEYFVGIITMSLLLLVTCISAEKIGEVTSKGMVFKDRIEIHAIDDPTIQGVTCYVTEYKVGGSIFGNSKTSSSISCRQVGEIKGKLCNKANIYSKSKNIFFKKGFIDRFYDARRNVLIYISYTKATGGNNGSHSISVVPLSN